MSTSEKQLIANRQNAQKSTGPKTEEGKKASSRNAITHGLHSTDIVINSPHLKEDQSLYDELVQSLFDELKPTGVLQEHLVLKIANCMWRYRRLIKAETGAINDQIMRASLGQLPASVFIEHMGHSDQSEEFINQVQSRSVPRGESGFNLQRYAWRLDREIYRTYRLLRLLKKIAVSSRPEIQNKDVKV